MTGRDPGSGQRQAARACRGAGRMRTPRRSSEPRARPRDRACFCKARRCARSWSCRASWSISSWDNVALDGLEARHDSVALSRRDRSGYDELRGRVCRHARARAAVGRYSQFPGTAAGRTGETAPRAMLPSFLYLPGEHELPPGRGAAALERGARTDRGRVRAVSGGEGARPQRLERQELALSSRDRPRGRHPPLGQPAGGQEGLAGRGVGGLPAAHSRRLERHVCAATTIECGSSSKRSC